MKYNLEINKTLINEREKRKEDIKEINSFKKSEIFNIRVYWKKKEENNSIYFNKITEKINESDETIKPYTRIFSKDSLKNLFNSNPKDLLGYEDIPNNLLYFEKVILNDTSNVYLIGDLHSSLESLIQILIKFDNKGIFDKTRDDFILNKGNHIIFLGDIVDRGPYSIETLLLVLFLKKNNFKNVHIINGNHEDLDLYFHYSFFKEKDLEFDNDENFYRLKLRNILSRLPTAIFLKFKSDNKWFQLCHGGIDPRINPKKFLESNKKYKFYEGGYNSNGLKWSDFSMDESNYRVQRGRGWVYGPRETKKYLDNNYLYSIISGHQDFVNLSFLPTDTWENNKTYFRGSSLNNFCPYNLLCSKEGTSILNLDPVNDFLALNTSSATGPRINANHDTYLKLSSEIDIIKKMRIIINKLKIIVNKIIVKIKANENFKELYDNFLIQRNKIIKLYKENF